MRPQHLVRALRLLPCGPRAAVTSFTPRLRFRFSPAAPIRPATAFLRPYSSSTDKPDPPPTPTSTPSPSPTSSEPNIKPYTYPLLKSLLSTSPSHSHQPSPLLIDVREPSEYAGGHIPTAHNLPILSRPDALFLPPEEFLDAFGFEKPEVEEGREVIFYCKAGIRSAAAARMAWEVGYRNVGEYPGSWMDWMKNEEAGGKGGQGEGR